MQKQNVTGELGTAPLKISAALHVFANNKFFDTVDESLSIYQASTEACNWKVGDAADARVGENNSKRDMRLISNNFQSFRNDAT